MEGKGAVKDKVVRAGLCEIRQRRSHVTIKKSFSAEVRANAKGLRHEFIGEYEELHC